mgnify:CR=1 FL=1
METDTASLLLSLYFFPIAMAMLFPETWIAVVASATCGWFRVRFTIALSVAIAAGAYIAFRMTLVNTDQRDVSAVNVPTSFLLAAASTAAVLCFLGYLFGRWLSDK